MAHLRIYNKENNIVIESPNIEGKVGKIKLTNLSPDTLYNQGEFYITWVGKTFESTKLPLPTFKTKQETSKEFVFYWKDSLIVNPKSAYDIAVDNGFKGTQKEWLESLRGENISTPIEIDHSEIDEEGNTIVYFTNDTYIKVLRGKDGGTFSFEDLTEEDFKKILDYGIEKGYFKQDTLDDANDTSNTVVSDTAPSDKNKIWINIGGK